MKLTNKTSLFQKISWPLIIIVSIGLIIRIKGIIEGSFAFTYDVGRDMLAVRDIVVNHHIPFIGPTTGLAGVLYGPWWYYILTPSFMIGMGDPKAVASFIALLGILTIIGGYWIGRKLHNSLIAITLAGLLSFSPVMLGLSTQIWNPNIAPIITLIIYILFVTIFSDLRKQKKQKWHYFFLLGVFMLLSFEAEIVYGTLLTVGVILGCLIFLRQAFSRRNILSFFAGAFIICSPRLLFEIKHHFLMSRELFASFNGKLTSRRI